MEKMKKTVARIFEEPTGKYHVCDDAQDYLDARGTGFDTRRAAISAAAAGGQYTHYLSPSGREVPFRAIAD